MIKLKGLLSALKGWAFGRFIYASSKRETKRMSKADRKNYVRKIIEDIFVDGLEDAHFKNKLTRHEVTKAYNFLAKHFDLRDLKVPEPPALPTDPKEYSRAMVAMLRTSKKLNGPIFPKLKAVKVNHKKEMEDLKKILASVDQAAIEEGLERAKKLEREDRKAAQMKRKSDKLNGSTSHEEGAQNHGK